MPLHDREQLSFVVYYSPEFSRYSRTQYLTRDGIGVELIRQVCMMAKELWGRGEARSRGLQRQGAGPGRRSSCGVMGLEFAAAGRGAASLGKAGALSRQGPEGTCAGLQRLHQTLRSRHACARSRPWSMQSGERVAPASADSTPVHAARAECSPSSSPSLSTWAMPAPTASSPSRG